MKISYCITVCDENEEIKKLMSTMIDTVNLKEDEIIILCDISKSNKDVLDFCEECSKYDNISVIKDTFQNHFAEWKNKFKEVATGDYIFQIDADEIPNVFLLQNIKEFIKLNKNIELFWVPRENYVDGLTEEHIIKWNMQIDKLGRINFPDYQARIFVNKPEIGWINKVHEIITGCRKQAAIPPNPKFCLIHIKNIEKQEKQNQYYETL